MASLKEIPDHDITACRVNPGIMADVLLAAMDANIGIADVLATVTLGRKLPKGKYEGSLRHVAKPVAPVDPQVLRGILGIHVGAGDALGVLFNGLFEGPLDEAALHGHLDVLDEYIKLVRERLNSK
jgi:hypothetical protein